MNVVNKSDYPTRDVKRLTQIVMKRAKKVFIMPPLETIHVESYDSKRYEGEYNGSALITIRLGRNMRYPGKWDSKAEIVNWEDLYVALLFWCVTLHYQRSMWLKKPYLERKTTKQYRRGDSQELTIKFLKQWRVEDAYKLIMEKANAD